MKQFGIALVLLLALVIDLFATYQTPERVIFKGHNYALMVEGPQSNQLVQTFPLPVSGPLSASKYISTACRRGYVGQWELSGDKLFLIKLHDSQRPPGEIPLSRVKEGWESPVFADWVSGKFHLIAERSHADSPPRYLRHHVIELKDGKVTQSTTLADLTATAKGWLQNFMRFKTGDQIDYHHQVEGLEMQSLLSVEAVDEQGRFQKGTLTILSCSKAIPDAYRICLSVDSDGVMKTATADGSQLNKVLSGVEFRSLVLPPEGTLLAPEPGLSLDKIISDPQALSLDTWAGCSAPDFYALAKKKRFLTTRKQVCGGVRLGLQAGSRAAPWDMKDKDTPYLDLRVECSARYRSLPLFDFKYFYGYNQEFLLSFNPQDLVPVHFSQDSRGSWLRRYHPSATPETVKKP